MCVSFIQPTLPMLPSFRIFTAIQIWGKSWLTENVSTSAPCPSPHTPALEALSTRRYRADGVSVSLLSPHHSFGPTPQSRALHMSLFPSSPEAISKACNLVKGQGPVYQTPHGAFYKLLGRQVDTPSLEWSTQKRRVGSLKHLVKQANKFEHLPSSSPS